MLTSHTAPAGLEVELQKGRHGRNARVYGEVETKLEPAKVDRQEFIVR